MGREAKQSNNLTRKQSSFVKRLILGDSATQAALATYGTSDPKVASSIASENLNKPAIREAIEQAFRSKGLSLDVIVSNIGELANHKPTKISGETKLKANIELLKLLGAYYLDRKRSSISVSFSSQVSAMTFSEAKASMLELQATTEELMADIETTPHTT
ncbi:MAG: hypothetical protein GW947_02205 [Candidatus Pacebacteria bacterium]|nr:hypothetical protein [Candidatus Paceibacterota bacterium]